MAEPISAAATAAIQAIQAGDLQELRAILQQYPELVNARVDGQRTLLHVATDWPGHFPSCPATVTLLLSRGAEPNAPFVGPHSETPLHWAASSNDVAVLDVLLDHGADIEAPGAVIGGGTAIADAVAFATWDAARRLVERGASTNLCQSAALGLMDRVESFFALDAAPPPDSEITKAFWCACHGGQQRAAEYLLARGANPKWIGYDHLTPLGAAQRAGADALVAWLQAI
ncbi:MAG TPA: ankyrin repeat domain-containing protein [Bryobacteraceae bacterium]|nr:ankyrin repeat domain-containing protein [Bryobacteraceae bacterium]